MNPSNYYNDRTGEISIWKIFWVVLGFFIAAGLILAVVGFAAGWFNAGKEIVSPDNVKSQNYAIIQDFESAKALSLNACQAQNTKTDENSPTLVEDPAFAYSAKYRSVVADYNRRQRNLFEARIAGPPSYPDKIPNLETGAKTDWCEVNAQLEALHY